MQNKGNRLNAPVNGSEKDKTPMLWGSHADAATIDDNAVNRSAISEFGIVIVAKGQYVRVGDG